MALGLATQVCQIGHLFAYSEPYLKGIGPRAAQTPLRRDYGHLVDGECEAHLVALASSAPPAGPYVLDVAPADRQAGRTRLH